MHTSNDSQARWRERNRARLAREARERRQRAREDDLGTDAACCCCGEQTLGFLIARGSEVRCRNCDHMLRHYGYCSHGGISRRLG